MKKISVAISLFISASAFAQSSKAPANWQTLDPEADHVYGTGIDQAYKTLTGKQPQNIIVAVIDGGTDVEHQDLKDIIWTNPGEIPDNGIDDDHNGYIDDVHGWSFIGGKNGDIDYEATELARIYQKMNKKFRDANPSALNGDDAKEYKEFTDKIKPAYLKAQAEADAQAQQLGVLADFISKVKTQTKQPFTKASVKLFVPETTQDAMIKKRMKLILTLISAEELDQQVTQGANMIINNAKYNKMNVDSLRRYIVGDNPDDPNERYYGNNHVKGPDALHGSHVAGIIAAVRDNNIGIQGIANDVKIMVVRAVPDGDERDKDVANAIRYAVDNGAKVINMSFGKYYSPDKKVVDEAVKYALSKDVLLIHAAGNESKDKDVENSYPSRDLLDGSTASNWIEVGASSYKKGKKLVGDFSNYGKTKVDFFAPGVDIYSTIPDNKYTNESGTSMASPSTAGVAAVIREYFPELKSQEVRETLMKSVVTYKKKVRLPGSKKTKTRMKELCITGGFVNANNAVKMLLKK